MADHIPELRRKKMPQINIFGRFLSRRPLEKFIDKSMLDNIMAHALKKKFSENVYNRRRKLFQILHFRITSVLPHLNFSIWFCQIWKLKTTIFQTMYNTVLFLSKSENVIKKLKVYSKGM